MNINISSIISVVLAAIVLLVLIFSDDATEQNTTNIQLPKTKTNTVAETTKDKVYKDIEISYSDEKKPTTKNEVNKTNKKQINKQKLTSTENKTKIYELISTGSNINGYEINVASSQPIPTRNPSRFPQIPASIQGSIDGKKFSLVIPSDLGVKDFKVKVKNQKTGEVKFIELGEENVKAGSSSVLIIDTNNFENIELRSTHFQTPPMPPLPSF